MMYIFKIKHSFYHKNIKNIQLNENIFKNVVMLIGFDDTRKNYNSFLVHDGSSWSTTSAHGNQDEETRPEPSRKDESGILVLSKTSSWVN